MANKLFYFLMYFLFDHRNSSCSFLVIYISRNPTYIYLLNYALLLMCSLFLLFTAALGRPYATLPTATTLFLVDS